MIDALKFDIKLQNDQINLLCASKKLYNMKDKDENYYDHIHNYLKSFGNCNIYKFYNPYNKIRLLDGFFYLDSSYLNTKLEDRKEFSLPGSVVDAYVIENYIQDENNNSQKFFLKEKECQKCTFDERMKELSYTREWLLSMNDSQSFVFSNIIEHYQKKLNSPMNQHPMAKEQTYYKWLNKPTVEWIKNRIAFLNSYFSQCEHPIEMWVDCVNKIKRYATLSAKFSLIS